MGEVFGDISSIEDFGNAPEILIQSKAIPAWERVNADMARLFVVREVAGRKIHDHTDLMSRADMIAIGKRFLEIADKMGSMGPLHWSGEILNRMLC